MLVLFGSAFVPSLAASGDAPRAVQENNAGVRALEANRLDEAIEHFERARALAPKEETVLANLSGAYKARGTEAEKAGRFDAARRDYLAALALEPDDLQTLRLLAVLANNQASAAVGRRRLDEARRFFREALEYLPRLTDPAVVSSIRMNYARFLTLEGDALDAAGRPDKARADFQEALRYEPRNPIALTSLGDLDYDDDAYTSALQYYARAVAVVPSSRPDLREALQRRIDTLRKELVIERDFVRITDRFGRFRLFVPRDFSPASAAHILQTMNEAYQKVGRDFDFVTTRPFTAKVYTRAQLEAIRHIPAWMVGLYDGKLRLLEERLLGGKAQLRNLIYHEYTHSVIQRLGGEKVPSWLHEGLAQIEEPESRVSPREMFYLKAQVRGKRVASLGEMTEPFPRTRAGEKMPLIYLKSRLVVDFLLKKHGWPAMRELLRETRRRDDFDASFRATFGESVEEMEKQWRRRLLGNEGTHPRNPPSSIPHH